MDSLTVSELYVVNGTSFVVDMSRKRQRHIVSLATPADFVGIGRVAAPSFSGYRGSIQKAARQARTWYRSDDDVLFTAKDSSGTVVGYIDLRFHGGLFRIRPCIELYQTAVDPELRGHGVGRILIEESYRYVCLMLAERKEMYRPEIVDAHVWFNGAPDSPLRSFYGSFFELQVNEKTGAELMRMNFDDRLEVQFRKIIELQKFLNL